MTDEMNYKVIPCARCEAKVNEDCVTVTGKKTGFHSARTDPLDLAYGNGYNDGCNDSVGSCKSIVAEERETILHGAPSRLETAAVKRVLDRVEERL